MSVCGKICHILRSETLLGVEWGFHSPSWSYNYFSFGVRGVSFEGKVKIMGKECQEYYTIIMTNEFDEEVKRIHQVHETELVSILKANIDGSESWKYIKQKYYIQKYFKTKQYEYNKSYYERIVCSPV